eukprot:SAG11_NODE_5132_length_1655_cov_29.938946_1_plen_482_part_00
MSQESDVSKDLMALGVTEPEPEEEHELQTPAEEAMIEAVKATKKFTVNVIVTFFPTQDVEPQAIEQLNFDLELNSVINEQELMLIIQRHVKRHTYDYDNEHHLNVRYDREYFVRKISVAGPSEFWDCLNVWKPRKPGPWLFSISTAWIDQEYEEMISNVEPETELFKTITDEWERDIQMNEDDSLFDGENFEQFVTDLTRELYSRLDEKFLPVGPDGLQHMCDYCDAFARYFFLPDMNGINSSRPSAICRDCLGPVKSKGWYKNFIKRVLEIQTENPDRALLSAESVRSIQSQLEIDDGFGIGILDDTKLKENIDVIQTFYVPKPIESEPVPDSQESEVSLPSPSVMSRKDLEDTVRSIQEQNKLFTYHAVEKSNHIDELKKKLKESEQQRMIDSEKFKEVLDAYSKKSASNSSVLSQLTSRLEGINESHPALGCLEGFDGFKLEEDPHGIYVNFSPDDSTDDSESQPIPESTDGVDSQDP